MSKGESNTGDYSSRGIGIPVAGAIGGGDSARDRLGRGPKSPISHGSPWRKMADDEFAGTYLSRVNKGYDVPEEMPPMFPDQDDDPDPVEDENYVQSLKTRKLPTLYSIVISEEENGQESQMKERKENPAEQPKGDPGIGQEGFKFWDVEGPDEAEDSHSESDPSERYAAVTGADLGRSVRGSTRRPSDDERPAHSKALSEIRFMVRETIERMREEGELSTSDSDRTDEEDDLEEINTVASVAPGGMGPVTKLGTNAKGEYQTRADIDKRLKKAWWA